MKSHNNTVDIAPFAVSDKDGVVRAIVTSPKFWGAVAAGGALGLMANGEAVAHSDESESAEVEDVVVQQNSSPWEAMQEAGYTEAEIATDMALKNITEDVATHPIVQPGDVWAVSTEVQRLKQERLSLGGQNTGALPQTVTLSQPNDTFWGELEEIGLEDQAQSILAYNNITPEKAQTAQVGDSIVISTGVVGPVQQIESIEQTVTIEATPEAPAPLPAQEAAEPITPPVVETLPLEQPTQPQSTEVAPVDVVLQPTETVTENSTIDSVYLLGDSVMLGLYELGGLEEAFLERGITATLNAETSRSMKEAMAEIEPAIFDGYDAVVVALGANAKESDERFEKELRELIAEVQTLPVPPTILISNLFELGDNDRIPEASRNQIITDVVIEAQQNNIKIQMLDWYGIGINNPAFFEGSDGVHPVSYQNAAQQFMAQFEALTLPALPAPAEQPPAITIAEPVLQAPTHTESVAVSPEKVQATTYAEYVAQRSYAPMPEELRILKEQADALPSLNERVAARAAFMQQYSEWLRQTVTLTPEGYALFLQSGINKDYSNVFGNRKPLNTGQTIDVECSVKHWMAGRPETIEQLAVQMKHNVQFTVWADGIVYQTTPEANSLTYHAAGVNKRCYGAEIWGEDGTDFTPAMIEASQYLDLYMSQTYGYELTRDVAAIEQSPLDGYGDFYPSDEIIRNTTFLTHKSVDRVFSNSPVGKIDIPEYMANWMFLQLQSFRYEADALLVLHNTPPEAVVAPIPVVEVATEAPVEAPAEEIIGSPEVLAEAWALNAEDYIARFNNGEHVVVQLRGDNPLTVPAEVQKLVDIIWRLEGGYSFETVKEALAISLAESGWNNTAINPNSGDRCLFQINKINRKLVTEMGYDYDTLQDNPEACVRVAFELFTQSVGFVYSKNYIERWGKYGLKLPDDLMNAAVNGAISKGWQWWLMSARKTGLL